MHDDIPQPPAAAVLEFRLPDLGEGLADADLVSWAVEVGDCVELNQTLAEVETAKAVVSLPSPYAGRVVELLAQPGDTVSVGAPLIRIEQPHSADQPSGGVDTHTSVLVGYGPTDDTPSRRRYPARKQPSGASPSGRAIAPGDDTGSEPARADDSPPTRGPAVPAARKLARELGIELSSIAGSGPGGAVTVDDVLGTTGVAQPGAHAHGGSDPAYTDLDMGTAGASTSEVRIPISGVRKATATAMVTSARTIPQATVFRTVDCTASMELLDHLRATPSPSGVAVTPLALVAKSALVALAEFPGMNAYWDEPNQEIVIEHEVNLGIAVATDRGLLVPNIKQAQVSSLTELAGAIGRIVDVTRAGRATLTDLGGGTFTITNIGVFDVDAGVPLVNPGESAILCLGAIRRRPWVVGDELAVRWVTTLGVAFDHRMIDGELAARFLATTAGLLEDPLTLLGRL